MKVIRFMNKEEFRKFNEGQLLVNVTNHKKDSNRRTNSEGFCFLSLDDYTPEQAMHFLSGIVSFDVCAVFETNADNFMTDILNLLEGYTKMFTATEYSINQYSNKDFKLIKYIENVWEQWKPLEKQEELKWKYARANNNSKDT